MKGKHTLAVALAVTAVSSLTLVSGCVAGCKGSTLTAEQCEDMTQHMGDVFSPNEDEAMRAARHASRRASSGHDQRIADCKRDVRRPQFDCVMAAKTQEDLKKCDGS